MINGLDGVSPKGSGQVSPNLPNVQLLGKGFGRSVAPFDMIRHALSTVSKRQTEQFGKATRSHLQNEAAALGLSYNDYLVMLAVEDARKHGHQDFHVDISIVRFLTKIQKQAYFDLVRDLEKIRNKAEVKSVENDKQRGVVFHRLESLFG